MRNGPPQRSAPLEFEMRLELKRLVTEHEEYHENGDKETPPEYLSFAIFRIKRLLNRIQNEDEET